MRTKILILSIVMSIGFISMIPANDTEKCSTSLATIFERNDGTFYMKFSDGNTVDISSTQANFICNKK